MDAIAVYALLNKKIKGLISGIQGVSISGTTITFTMVDGTKEIMTFPTPADGVSITDVDVDTDKHLIVTFSDGNTIDAGEIPTVKGDKGDKGEKGDTGFSPTITENPDNTNEIYKLDVTNEDGTFTTPNLKGTGGGLDPDKYYDKAQIDTLVEPLAEAKHTHDNKDTVLDKLTTNDAGDTLLFNGNAIKGSVEIDDTTTEATDKVWSTKKTNDTFEEVKQSITDTNAKFADYDTYAEVDGKITTALADYEKSVDVNTKITTALQDYDKSDVIDSKITTALTDYIKTEDVDTKLAEYDKSTVVNKKITDTLADYDTSEVVDNKLKDYAKTTEVDTKFADYYKKTETYSNTEVDDKFTDFETTLTNAIKTWVDSEESLALKTTLFKNNTLTFYKKPNATVDDTADFTINLPEEQFLDQTKTTFVNEFVWSEELYPNSTNPNLDTEPVLVLAVKGDTDVVYSFISMNKLVKIYKASTVASTVTLAIDDATNTISGEVNISADEGNLLEVGTDGGLYAKATDITGKADKVAEADIKENQILLDDGAGNIKASGKDISEYIPAWSGTKAQWNVLDKTTLADGSIIHITDDFIENPVQVKAMPDIATEGDVVQYIGLTDTSYTHGYFYEYAVNETGILSWKYLPVDAVYKPSNEEVLNKFSENDEGKVLYDNKPLASDNLWHGTQAEYDALGEYDENKTYVITDGGEDADLSDVMIDDTSTTSETKSWSVKKINDTVVLKNARVLNKNAPTSSGITTFTLDISSLGLTHGIYHFKCCIVGNGNVAYCAEGSIGQYTGSYRISVDYKSSQISSIVINGTTITVTTSAAYYNLSFSIQSIYDWIES